MKVTLLGTGCPVAHPGRAGPAVLAEAGGLGVACRILAPDRPIMLGELEITPVPVDHGPVRPAYGLVFHCAGKRAVISGDTRAGDALVAAGRGADLLVHEVFVHRDMLPEPGRRDPETVAAVASQHTLSGEAGGVARAMGARALAPSHFVPPDFDRGALLAEVGESYAGPVFIGEDPMSLDLARREVGWRAFRARLP